MKFAYISASIFLILHLFSCKEKTPLKGVSNKITLETISASSITADSAMSGGIIINDGGDNIVERGVCWSTSKNPTIKDFKQSSVTSTGNYIVKIKPLSPNTIYYIRAYTISNQGEVYGNELSFKTLIKPPIVSTVNITNITSTSFTTGGMILSDGGETITDKGIVWSSRTSNPTIIDNVFSIGVGNSNYVLTIPNLLGSTTYWARAYARNSAGISYGSIFQISTLPPTVPILSSIIFSNITRNTATISSSILSNGGAVINRYGYCYNTSSTMSGGQICNFINSNILGQFTMNINNLNPNTTYYVRAYGINSVGSGLSPNIQSFTTLPAVAPTVTTDFFSNVSFSSVRLNGNVTDDGGAAILERGFFLSTNPTPTTSSIKIVANTNGTGSFSESFFGLNPGTTYFFRAYARNSINTTLSPIILSFTTLSANVPTLTTNTISNLTATSFTTGGNITSNGGAPITSNGIVWSTSPNPTTNNNVLQSGTVTGSFVTNITGLQPNSTIYVRAYAQNSALLIGYGQQIIAITQLAKPILLNPQSSSTMPCCTLNFNWGDVSSATSYEIQVSRDINFTGTMYSPGSCSGISLYLNGVNSQFVNSNSACFRAPGSSGNGTWYWRVRAISSNNNGQWSDVRSFVYRW